MISNLRLFVTLLSRNGARPRADFTTTLDHPRSAGSRARVYICRIYTRNLRERALARSASPRPRLSLSPPLAFSLAKDPRARIRALRAARDKAGFFPCRAAAAAARAIGAINVSHLLQDARGIKRGKLLLYAAARRSLYCDRIRARFARASCRLV